MSTEFTMISRQTLCVTRGKDGEREREREREEEEESDLNKTDGELGGEGG